MNNSIPQKPSVWQRSPLIRFARWLLSPRVLGRLLFLVATLATIVGLFYAEELWRGKHAWNKYTAAATAGGIRLDWDSFIPAPVKDEENLAATPALAPLFDFLPGTQQWRDTNASQKLFILFRTFNEKAKARGFDVEYGRQARWQLGEPMDLIALLGTNKTLRTTAPPTVTPLPEEMRKRYGLPDSPPEAITPNPAPARPSFPPGPATQEEAARILLELVQQTYGPLLDELSDASQRPRARFNIQYNTAPIYAILLPHLAYLKSCAQALSRRAQAQLALDQASGAMDDIQLGFHLADTLNAEPFLISQLVHIASKMILMSPLWHGFARHAWTESQLQQLQARLENDNIVADLNRALHGERASGVRIFDQILYRTGGVSLGNLGSTDGSDTMGEVVQMIMPSGWFYLEKLNLSSAYDRCLEPLKEWLDGKTATQPALQQLRKLGKNPLGDENGDWSTQSGFEKLWRHQIMVSMLFPAVDRAFEKALNAQVHLLLVQQACALERHYLTTGQYPEKLENMVPKFIAKLPLDPMSGKPFVYRRQAQDAYLLYSIGFDFQDDGGTVGLTAKGVIDPLTKDLVWRIPSRQGSVQK